MSDDQDYMEDWLNDFKTVGSRRGRNFNTQTNVSLGALNELVKATNKKTEAQVQKRLAVEKQTEVYEQLKQEEEKRNQLLERLVLQLEYYLQWSKELHSEFIAPNLDQHTISLSEILRAQSHMLQRLIVAGDNEAKDINKRLEEVMKIMAEGHRVTVNNPVTHHNFGKNATIGGDITGGDKHGS